MTEIRSQPCTACPYREDVPSGVWAWEEYEKLRLYDAETMHQPPQGFRCHATPDHFCHGWAVVHTSRGHRFDLLALRIFYRGEAVPTAAVPLFESGTAAADHGQAEVNDPSDQAVETAQRLLRKHHRLVT